MEIEALGRVAHRWPDARIIVAHCGTPAVEATLALLRSTRSVYADLTPVTPMLAPITRTTIAGLERRLLFGSDAPNGTVSIEKAIAHIRTLELDPGDEAAVLGSTAEQLLARR
jgi:predicted TIM-barrel fold metal-dependent hydrolase